MDSVTGKVAFITGGASGIGFGIAQAFLAAGMRVAIADVRPQAVADAVAALGQPGRVHGVVLDVSDRAAMTAAADEVERVFGPVQVLCNNAGIGLLGGAKSVSYDDWDWCLSVNLGGVINGVQTFLPRMLAHSQGGHIVNTSSIGAVSPGEGGVAYLTAKAGVQVLSEALCLDLLDDGIGVTVLVPGPTRTNINQVGALRPERYQNTGVKALEAQLAQAPLFENGLDALDVGRMVLDAVRRNLLFVFTHNDFKAGVGVRFQAILDAFPRGPVDPERGQQFGFPLAHPHYAALLARAAAPADPTAR